MICPMPEVRDGMPGGPTRRAALGVIALAAATLPLAACGIRLEDDAPRVPLVPTREPLPAEGFLLGLWLASGDLATQASALGGAATAIPTRLAALHREQERVLRSVLRSMGVPDRAVAEAQESHRRASATATTPPATPSSAPASQGAPSPSGQPTPAPTPPPSPIRLGEAEAAALAPESLAGLADVPRASVAVAAAALAQRAAAAALLGSAVTWPEQSGVPAEVAVIALDGARAAVYGLEVVAAQSRAAQRTLATSTLATLRARVAALEELAGEAAPAPALGYPLPFPVTTEAAARRLALHVLTGLRETCARTAGAGARDASALAAVVQWLAEAEGLAHRWGLPLEPFPGLV